MHIKLRTFVFVLVMLALVLFAALNWELFIQPMAMNLIFARVVAPFGLLMLAIIAGLTILYLTMLAKSEAGAILSHRRSTKELDEARKLALSAEESRLRELRELLDERLDRIDDNLAELLARQNSGVTTTRTVVREVEPIDPTVPRAGEQIGT